MGKRLSVKHRKTARNKARAYKEGTAPVDCKVAVERSRKDKLRKAFRK